MMLNTLAVKNLPQAVPKSMQSASERKVNVRNSTVIVVCNCDTVASSSVELLKNHNMRLPGLSRDRQ